MKKSLEDRIERAAPGAVSLDSIQMRDLLVTISRLYYKDDRSHLEIAKATGLSRFQVAKLLKKAREDGVVRIEIQESVFTDATLEGLIERASHLRRAIVVRTREKEDPEEVKRRVGVAGAVFLGQILRNGDVLGVSWGSTVNAVAEALDNRKRHVEVVQINGGGHWIPVDMSAHEITRRFANKFGTQPHLLHAPIMVDSEEVRDTLLLDSTIRETTRLFEHINTALLGIGSLYPTATPTLRLGGLQEEEFEELRRLGAVGDVFRHFFSKEGTFVDTPLAKRVISIPVDHLPRLEYSIGVATGVEKALAIAGAIRGQLITVLVTDDRTAQVVAAALSTQ